MVPELTTSRLVLRAPRIEDFDSFAAFMADEESARYLGGVQSRHSAWRGFLQIAGAWSLQGFSMFSVTLKSTGEWIGRVGPWMPEGWPGTEVGWGVAQAHCGQGYATEAAAAAIDWAFAELGWDDVVHVIDPENKPSLAVAKKLGASNRGRCRLPEPLHDLTVDLWGQSRAEWQQSATNRLGFS